MQLTLMGVVSENGKNRTLSRLKRSERPEFAGTGFDAAACSAEESIEQRGMLTPS